MGTRIQFGLFEFDSDAGTLVRDGVPVKLQPQPARVLSLLTERPGDVVLREELRQRVWSEGTFVDFERGLNFCIGQIRSALGDSAEAPRYIETVPRRGYRFIAPVRRVAGADAEPEQSVAAPVLPSSPASARQWVWPLAGALLLGVTAAIAVRASIARSPVPIRVVVLPFDNETGTQSFEDVARGVADETVARLATPDRVRRVSVIGNAAIARRPRAFRDIKQIGEALGAQYVVLAQVKHDQARIRLIAHLIRVSDQAHLWANTYDRPDFTLDVQSEVAESIAAAVIAHLSPG